MRILIQRVTQAAVDVDGERVGEIDGGLALLVAVRDDDTPETVMAMARKVVNMRLFPDPDGPSHIHRSLLDEEGGVRAVPQFTLYANCRKGRRPSFSAAADPEPAQALFDRFVECLRAYPLTVATGRFGAMMHVSLVNQGPVTIWLDSDEVLPGRR